MVKTRYPLKELPGGEANVQNVAERRGLSGYGQLRVNLPAFNAAAEHGQRFIVLTDLDVHVQCPGQLISSWLPSVNPSPNLTFRVAVKEVEAWLLADSANLAAFLAVDAAMMPSAVESLADPKLEIVRIASSSRSPDVISDLVPKVGSTAEVGRDIWRQYAVRRDHWKPTIPDEGWCGRFE